MINFAYKVANTHTLAHLHVTVRDSFDDCHAGCEDIYHGLKGCLRFSAHHKMASLSAPLTLLVGKERNFAPVLVEILPPNLEDPVLRDDLTWLSRGMDIWNGNRRIESNR